MADSRMALMGIFHPAGTFSRNLEPGNPLEMFGKQIFCKAQFLWSMRLWLTLIARKRPHLTRSRSYLPDASRHKNDNDHGNHYARSSLALGRIIEYLNHRLSGRGVKDTVKVSKTEDECDSNNNQHQGIGSYRPQHDKWNRSRCIVSLFGHMDGAIISLIALAWVSINESTLSEGRQSALLISLQ